MNQSTTTEIPRRRSIRTVWAAARHERVARRAARSSRERLAAELAAYSTPADQNDLNALLDSYADAEVGELRDLLNRRAA